VLPNIDQLQTDIFICFFTRKNLELFEVLVGVRKCKITQDKVSSAKTCGASAKYPARKLAGHMLIIFLFPCVTTAPRKLAAKCNIMLYAASLCKFLHDFCTLFANIFKFLQHFYFILLQHLFYFMLLVRAALSTSAVMSDRGCSK